MNIMINLPQILIWPVSVPTLKLFGSIKTKVLTKEVGEFPLCYMGKWAGSAYQHDCRNLNVMGFLNPITYGGGGGGFLARTIRLSTTTLKRLYLAPPNVVTFCFYLLDTLWQNFSKIDLPGGLLQLFLK